MTKDEALKIIEETEADYSQKQRVLRGLQILAKYDQNLDAHTSFEHDQIYVNDFEEAVVQMTKEDVVELAVCGWFESEDSWSHF